MLWRCGGHGECRTPAGDPRHPARRALAWLDRWVKRDVAVQTGPAFEWVADDGVWRSGPDFPLAAAGRLDAAGAGGVTLLPLEGLNPRLIAPPTPAKQAATLRFPSPPAGSDVLGAPRVKLVYHGSAVPTRTFLYAQVVDVPHGRVAGDQVTPIPVVLDGRTRTVERPLEMLALRAGPDSDLRLQLTSGTTVYGPQHSVGKVRLQSIQASLPLVDATRSGRTSQVAAARRRPPPLRISVTSRRRGAFSRIVLRSRLRTAPCAGTMRFTIRARSVRRTARAAVTRRCTAGP